MMMIALVIDSKVTQQASYSNCTVEQQLSSID